MKTKTKKCGIYKITNPSGRVYIGQSTNIDKRVRYYQGGFCKGQSKLYCSIKKYGWEKHRFEILNRCDEHELNNLEAFYISLFNSFNTPHGMNLTSGGDVVKCADETKLKRSLTLKGRVFTQEWKDKIGAKSKGRMVGFKHSEESKEKMRLNRKPQPYRVPYNKGKGYSKEEARIRHNSANRKWRKKIKDNKINEQNIRTNLAA
jgi:group I intron endonuclease